MLFAVTLLFVFLGVGLFVMGFFKPAPEADFDAAFRVNVDNLQRRTIFDIPELRPVLWPFHQIARRIAVERLRRRVLRNLRALGNPDGLSPDEYLTLCLLWGLGWMAVLWAFNHLFLDGAIHLAVLLPIGFIFGFGMYEHLLASRAAKRLRKINVQMPYGLDLLAMTMQAGATFYEAARTVSQQDAEEPLNQELGIVVREIEFGRSRQESLQHFADRIPLDSLSSIIAAVLQAEQLGTPLAEVLRLQANLLRMYRSMRAEKRLGEATVKLLVPLMLIFMAVILIIFGPVVVRFFRGELYG